MNFEIEEIELVGGAKVTIPRHYHYDQCKKCPANDLIWATTVNGNPMPIHFVLGKGWVSHFSDCPHANDFRKGGKNG